VIPSLINAHGAPWPILPPGIHWASLVEIKCIFAINPIRRKQYAGLIAAAQALALADCKTLYLDGSYITGKPNPGDYDGCWDPTGVDPVKLDPVLLDFDDLRKNQKAKYLGELFLTQPHTRSGSEDFLKFFQIEKFTGQPKGILAIDLTRESFN